KRASSQSRRATGATGHSQSPTTRPSWVLAGGVVRRRLKDPRFHPGLAITVVASGGTAKELHLGYDRKDTDEKTATSKAATKEGTKARAQAPDDDEDEFPGKVKSVDPTKRILVVTLVNGSDRSFILARDVAVLIRPERAGIATS